MNKLKKLLGSTAVAIYCIFPMSFILLLLIFMPVMFVSEVNTIRVSGFCGPNTGASYIGVCGLFIGLSLVIPKIRNMYKVFPWLYSYVKILYIDLIICSIGLIILNIGYEVQDTTRQNIFYILMIVEIIVFRIAMCIYLKLRPVKSLEDR